MARSVPAVVRALDVLELFLDGRGSLSAPEVAAALDLPRTTTHELLATLSEREYVERLPDNAHRFRLGVRVYELGSVYADALDVVRDGQGLVDEISARCGEICQLGLLDGRDVVYVARAGSPIATAEASSGPTGGRRAPALRTAAGRVLLAHMPRADLDRRLLGGSGPQASGLSSTGPGASGSVSNGLSGGLSSNGLSSNNLSSNNLSSTGLSSNGQAANGLSSNGQAGNGSAGSGLGSGAGDAARADAAAAERLRLWRDLSSVVARGVATDPEAADPATRAVAAAVRDHAGRVVAALEIRVATARWEPQRSLALETLVRRAAARASTRLGFRPPRTAENSQGAPLAGRGPIPGGVGVPAGPPTVGHGVARPAAGLRVPPAAAMAGNGRPPESPRAEPLRPGMPRRDGLQPDAGRPVNGGAGVRRFALPGQNTNGQPVQPGPQRPGQQLPRPGVRGAAPLRRPLLGRPRVPPVGAPPAGAAPNQQHGGRPLAANGMSGNGMSGGGMSGNGMPGNGTAGNGMPGNGMSGGGLQPRRPIPPARPGTAGWPDARTAAAPGGAGHLRDESARPGPPGARVGVNGAPAYTGGAHGSAGLNGTSTRNGLNGSGPLSGTVNGNGTYGGAGGNGNGVRLPGLNGSPVAAAPDPQRVVEPERDSEPAG